MSLLNTAMPIQGVLAAYEHLLAQRGFTADAAQNAAAARLELLHSALLRFKAARQAHIRRIFLPPALPRGVYLWGGVGRGKSFLMDCFYESVPYRRKRRIHFHAFMQEVHAQLKALKGEADPLLKLAAQIAHALRLLCLDEFHIADIADAMLIGRLLEALFARGVILVMTSNYAPQQLYPNGLQRERFLPTIALLEAHLDQLRIDAGVDYRLRSLTQLDVFRYPADAAAEASLAESFASLAGEQAQFGTVLHVLGRDIPTRGQGNGVIWFDFNSLCAGPRAQTDYLEIARRYPRVLLSGIPRMSETMSAEARRFTWLVDIFYDHKVKLIATAAAAPEALYVTGIQASEFCRTSSRLNEMRSAVYLALPHLPQLAAMTQAMQPQPTQTMLDPLL
ncbi:MAG: cell division protein ZapE [Pseudomonadota bacterium]